MTAQKETYGQAKMTAKRMKLFTTIRCRHCGTFGTKRILAPFGVFCTDCGKFVYTY